MRNQMSQLPDIIELGPEDEARRLWDGAKEAQANAGDDLISLCESLDLGLHAAEILAISRLNPIKDSFPATIGLLLNMPMPDVDPMQDGINVPKSLQFTDVIDLLSIEELECVSPGMHRGWEDRRFACRRSRGVAQEATGVSLSAEDQKRLLVLAAYRNRLFRAPPPIRIETSLILPAFKHLEKLVEGLLAAG
jgi:hypothetical protein